MNKIRKYFILLSIILIFLLLHFKHYTTIGQMAFNRSFKNNVIYIEEKSKQGEGYTPYYVVDNNYNGKTLLLRKEILKDYKQMNGKNNDYTANYDGCDIDIFLNEDFYNNIDLNDRNKIIESTIVVTDEKYLYTWKFDSKEIKRKVFLLSLYEVTSSYRKYNVYTNEGKHLLFFLNPFHRKLNDSWRLRTPHTGYGTQFFYTDGGYAFYFCEGSTKRGIRPAFCLNNNQSVYKVGNHYFLEPVSEETSKNVADN